MKTYLFWVSSDNGRRCLSFSIQDMNLCRALPGQYKLTWWSRDNQMTVIQLTYRSNVCSVLWSTDSHLWKHECTSSFFVTNKWKWCLSDPLSPSPNPYTLGTLVSHIHTSQQVNSSELKTSLDSENDNIGQVIKDKKMKAWERGWYLDRIDALSWGCPCQNIVASFSLKMISEHLILKNSL